MNLRMFWNNSKTRWVPSASANSRPSRCPRKYSGVDEQRSKTDAADAEVLAEHTHQMPFTAWIALSASSMRLHSIVRHIETPSVQSAENQNRLHAAHGSTSTPGCVVQDLKRSVVSLELRIHKLRREAMALVRQDDLLRKRYELLVSIPGIAQVSGRERLFNPLLYSTLASSAMPLQGKHRHGV